MNAKNQDSSTYAMVIINPKLCKRLSIQVEIEQENKTPVPYFYIYHDKTINPKKCSYVRLDKADYAPHHDRIYLTKTQKDEFIKVMTSVWSMPRNKETLRGYDRAVDIWIDTFVDDEEKALKKFNSDSNGAYIMPDYKQLKTLVGR